MRENTHTMRGFSPQRRLGDGWACSVLAHSTKVRQNSGAAAAAALSLGVQKAGVYAGPGGPGPNAPWRTPAATAHDQVRRGGNAATARSGMRPELGPAYVGCYGAPRTASCALRVQAAQALSNAQQCLVATGTNTLTSVRRCQQPAPRGTTEWTPGVAGRDAGPSHVSTVQSWAAGVGHRLPRARASSSSLVLRGRLGALEGRGLSLSNFYTLKVMCRTTFLAVPHFPLK